MRAKHLLYLMAGLALWACEAETPVYESEIQRVDKLLSLNDSLQAVFDAVDSTKVIKAFPEVDSIHRIMTGPGAPQDDKSYWTETLAALEYVHHPYKKYVEDVSKMRKDLAFSKSQLLSLRNSLVDEKLDSNKVKAYLQEETFILSEIAQHMRKRIGPAENAMAVWDTARSTYLEILAKNDSLAQ